MARRGIVLAALLAVFLAEAASAQQPQSRAPRRKTAVETPAPPPAAPQPENPQQKPLLDLSELIGGLAFITEICSPGSAVNPWRARMETLLDAEGEASGLRARMTGAFNQGYADYSTTYRQCTEAARAVQRLMLRDAGRLAREIERRFGS